MAARELPDLSPEELAHRLAAVSPGPLSAEAVAALDAHYRELRRWNRTVSLIGPGTLDEIFPRHYGEALAALPLLTAADRVLVDVGSGAGFPGFVLAAARPDLDATLVEARRRKWAFLRAVARRAALPCRCLNARVGPSLPAEFPRQADLVTLRALKPTVELLGLLAGRLSPTGRILLWLGGETPPLPPGLAGGDERPLPGSARRRLVELRREGR